MKMMYDDRRAAAAADVLIQLIFGSSCHIACWDHARWEHHLQAQIMIGYGVTETLSQACCLAACLRRITHVKV